MGSFPGGRWVHFTPVVTDTVTRGKKDGVVLALTFLQLGFVEPFRIKQRRPREDSATKGKLGAVDCCLLTTTAGWSYPTGCLVYGLVLPLETITGFVSENLHLSNTGTIQIAKGEESLQQ